MIIADGLKGGDLEVDVNIILRWVNEMEFEDVTRFVWFWIGPTGRFLYIWKLAFGFQKRRDIP
jgi:hypothetical protein